MSSPSKENLNSFFCDSCGMHLVGQSLVLAQRSQNHFYCLECWPAIRRKKYLVLGSLIGLLISLQIVFVFFLLFISSKNKDFDERLEKVVDEQKMQKIDLTIFTQEILESIDELERQFLYDPE